MNTTPLQGLAAVDLADLRPSPNNPRVRMTDLEDLARSITEQGLIQPLVVQRIPGIDGYQVVAGHRRLAAVKNLGWGKVACIIRRDLLPDEELLAMLVENGQRAGLDPIEEAHALRRLVDAGKSEAQVGAAVGRHANWVRGRLMLLRLPFEEQEAVRAGHYTLSHATGLVRAENRRQRLAAKPTTRPVGRPKGVKTRPYFGDDHPLARAARARCGHRGSPKVAGVACGDCWEATIRADERERAAS